MMDMMSVHTNHPAAAYDPHLLGYVDFPGIEESDSVSKTLIDQVFSYYQEALFSTPRALEFLQNLGISDKGLLKEWGVGFSDRTLGKQLPDGDTQDGAWLRGNLQRKGLLVASGGEFFRGALVFPNVDDRGEITEAYGERITPKLRSGTPYYLYWSIRNAGFFNQKALGDHQSIFLCKNPLEALILSAAGYPNVVATLGLGGFDAEQLDALVGSRVCRVTTAYENTPEGRRVARLVSQALSACGIACYRLMLPSGMDLKGYVLKHGADALERLVNGSRPCVQTYEGLREDGIW
ncbi:MAG: hypothetical protein ABW090_03260 [Sedimenticola sp.]